MEKIWIHYRGAPPTYECCIQFDVVRNFDDVIWKYEQLGNTITVHLKFDSIVKHKLKNPS